MKARTFGTCLLGFAALILSASPPSRAEEIGADIRSITVLPSVDGTGLDSAQALQQRIGEYLYSTRQFVVQYSAYSLPGFTAKDLVNTFERLDSQLIIFAYVEQERFSAFLFDSSRPQEFIASSIPFGDVSEQAPLTQQRILDTFPAAFQDLMARFNAGQYQLLPGAQVGQGQQVADERIIVRELFRQLTSLEDSPYSLGANVGFARMAASSISASTVSLSVYGGLRISEKMRLEAGLDLFSYVFPHVDLRYRLPFFEEKYVKLSALGSVGMVMGILAEHRGFPASNIPSGGTFFGPGFSVEIPLAGVSIRGDLRFYLGSGTLLFGSYGMSYSL